MAVLLYVDMLGVKARWRRGGKDEVSDAFKRFEGYIAAGLHVLPKPARHAVTGGMDSDAAALVFEDAKDALAVGRACFQAAFRAATQREHPRDWLRGVLIPHSGGPLRPAGLPLNDHPNLTVACHHDDLLDAIALEQSGFKGMRLLVQRGTLTSRSRSRAALWVPQGDRHIPYRVIRQIHGLSYPSIAPAFDDFAWWMPHNMAWWPSQERRISDRIRWAAEEPEELVHAVATMVGIHGSAALLHGMQKDGCRVADGAQTLSERMHELMAELYEPPTP